MFPEVRLWNMKMDLFCMSFFFASASEAKCSASITGVFNDDNGHPCRPFPQISHTPRVFQLQCLQFVHVLTQSLAQTLAPGDRDHMSYSHSKTQQQFSKRFMARDSKWSIPLFRIFIGLDDFGTSCAEIINHGQNFHRGSVHHLGSAASDEVPDLAARMEDRIELLKSTSKTCCDSVVNGMRLTSGDVFLQIVPSISGKTM